MSVEIKALLRCKRHPRYMGVRVPTSSCWWCNRIYYAVLAVEQSAMSNDATHYRIRRFSK